MHILFKIYNKNERKSHSTWCFLHLFAGGGGEDDRGGETRGIHYQSQKGQSGRCGGTPTSRYKLTEHIKHSKCPNHLSATPRLRSATLWGKFMSTTQISFTDLVLSVTFQWFWTIAEGGDRQRLVNREHDLYRSDLSLPGQTGAASASVQKLHKSERDQTSPVFSHHS